ncbi:MAG: DNA gyrase subunit A [Candidatus Woesearchaeota archaeon]|nr:MAG: DNA gyrase subunit A [Candidatus Woesearchaeota archaeon]
MAEEIQIRLIDEEMKQSYVDYAMSVIVGRALPDVRDGLKPVHRRILYSMWENNLKSTSKFVKCAKVVGAVLGNLHPHGDIAVYDALVRMAQDFSLRYPLILGQGNFGSIDGDAAAAYRYTECKLGKFAEKLLEDIDKETVKFVPNFDNSSEEPLVLPSKVPNLLVNGSSGIAVGMATNIPPHNLAEVIDGLVFMIDKKMGVQVEELMKFVKGPDFPTGGIVIGLNGVREAYKTGRGKIVLRGKINFEEKGDRQRIIITEIPYQVNKSLLVEGIADLVKDRKIEGIVDIRDESDRDGMRIVLDLRKGANKELILNQLYSNTTLETTFGVINIALVNNEPRVLNLKELMLHYILHRKDVVVRRTKFDLRKAEERKHVVVGLITALENIDDVVSLIKKSKDTNAALKSLIDNYKLTEIQSKAILEMKLQKLTSLETSNLINENKELANFIEEFKVILASEERVFGIIKNELLEIKKEFGDKRRTEIIETGDTIIQDEDLIKKEEVVITLSHKGYIKRVPLETYSAQGRGGKGVIGSDVKEEDFIENLFAVNTHDTLLFFSNKGQVYWMKAYEIQEAGRYARGSAIVNLLNLDKDENINTLVPVKEFNDKSNLFFCTKEGVVKRTALNEFANPRKGGIMALKLPENDSLVNVLLTDGNKEIMIASHEGNAVRFNENDIRVMGRQAYGVTGIKLNDNDYVVGVTLADETGVLLTVTEKGYGKRTEVKEYRLISRGGKGVTNINITDKNGKVVGILNVKDNEDVILITSKSNVIRMNVSKIGIIGRNTQGVRLMKLDEKDKVISLTKVIG